MFMRLDRPSSITNITEGLSRRNQISSPNDNMTANQVNSQTEKQNSLEALAQVAQETSEDQACYSSVCDSGISIGQQEFRPEESILRIFRTSPSILNPYKSDHQKNFVMNNTQSRNIQTFMEESQRFLYPQNLGTNIVQNNGQNEQQNQRHSVHKIKPQTLPSSDDSQYESMDGYPYEEAMNDIGTSDDEEGHSIGMLSGGVRSRFVWKSGQEVHMLNAMLELQPWKASFHRRGTAWAEVAEAASRTISLNPNEPPLTAITCKKKFHKLLYEHFFAKKRENEIFSEPINEEEYLLPEAEAKKIIKNKRQIVFRLLSNITRLVLMYEQPIASQREEDGKVYRRRHGYKRQVECSFLGKLFMRFYNQSGRIRFNLNEKEIPQIHKEILSPIKPPCAPTYEKKEIPCKDRMQNGDFFPYEPLSITSMFSPKLAPRGFRQNFRLPSPILSDHYAKEPRTPYTPTSLDLDRFHSDSQMIKLMYENKEKMEQFNTLLMEDIETRKQELAVRRVEATNMQRALDLFWENK